MTGGYLVLERPNAGVVLSTNARFYAIVKPLYEELKPDSWAWVCITLWKAFLSELIFVCYILGLVVSNFLCFCTCQFNILVAYMIWWNDGRTEFNTNFKLRGKRAMTFSAPMFSLIGEELGSFYGYKFDNVTFHPLLGIMLMCKFKSHSFKRNC